MTKHLIYDPSFKAGKIKLPPVEWEKLFDLHNSEEQHEEQPKKKRKKRRPKDQLSRKGLLEVFDRRCAGKKWNWFGTLTLNRKQIPLWVANRAFDNWMYGVLGDDPELSFRWLRVTEYRASGENLRFHVFFRSSRMTSKSVWMAQWKKEVSGEADIAYCFTSEEPRQYLKDAVHPDSDFEIKEDYQN